MRKIAYQRGLPNYVKNFGTKKISIISRRNFNNVRLPHYHRNRKRKSLLIGKNLSEKKFQPIGMNIFIHEMKSTLSNMCQLVFIIQRLFIG